MIPVRMTTRRAFLSTLLLALPAAAVAATPEHRGRLYFARHGETVANATGHYGAETVDRFSVAGERQIAQLADELSSLEIEEVCVSPMLRAINTALPYLRRGQRTATIWPELAECCHQRDHRAPPSERLPRGGAITVPAHASQWFTTESGVRTFDPANYADGLAQVHLAAARVRAEFGRSGKNVLLIGHSLAGTRLLEVLLGIEPRGRFAIANAKVSSLLQRSDGSYLLESLNGKPV
jgi:broad specificity phosphatase PhoE